MTLDQMELAVASHVEALVQLGWRWEGRGLVPTIQTGYESDPRSTKLRVISTKSADSGNHSHTVGVSALDTVDPVQ